MLEEKKELASNALLVQLIKLRLIGEKTVELPWYSPAEGNLCARPLAAHYLKSLQTQLHDLKSSVSGELADNRKYFINLIGTVLTFLIFMLCAELFSVC